MTAKLSPAVVSVGPTDELVANDGRGNTPQSTINKQSTQTSKQANVIGEGERESKIKIPKDKVKNFLTKKISEPKISDSAAQQGLEASIGKKLVSIYGATTNDPEAAKAQQRAVTAYRDDKTGRNKTELKDAAGNSIQIWDRADPTKVASLANAFKSIGSNVSQTGIIDEKGKFAAALGLLDQAVALGVPQLIDDIVTYVKNNKEAKRVLIESARQVIQRSDIPTLNKIIDLVGGQGVLSRVPDAISLLLMFYRFKWGTKTADYPARRAELIAVLNRLDANWNTTKRNGVATSNLSVTNYMSQNAKTLFLLAQPGTTDDNFFDQPYLLEAVMAGAYPFRNLQQLGRSMYPEIAVWGG